jgi:nucleotide-binding universal stress UspA family protein
MEKYMKVIIATDGSDFSKVAVEKFCKIAGNPENWEIKIISVYERLPPVFAGPYAFLSDFNDQYEDMGKEAAKKYTSDTEAQIRQHFPNKQVNITMESLLGMPGPMIVEIAKGWDADLIVVGSHGYGLWDRLLLGSASNTIVHHAPCSVLVVRM